MNRVNWNGEPLSEPCVELPRDIKNSIFDFLPEAIEFTPFMESLADDYLNCKFTGLDYIAKQSATFLKPACPSIHAERQKRFIELDKRVTEMGFEIPAAFKTLVTTKDYIDRIHHNTIWPTLPEELWRLPSDPSKLVFLAFEEGQGCCNWHLLLSEDGQHNVVCCEHPFGLISCWPNGVPDYSKWIVESCADSIEEWLYHYFAECNLHNESYIANLNSYRLENGG